MATAPIVVDHRQAKALGIAQRHECIPLDDYPGYYGVRDTLTGSGKFHITTWLECSCADFTYRHKLCRHIAAVRETEASLQAYAAAWDLAVRPACPQCGAELICLPYHVGGRGLVDVIHCAADKTHYSKRA